MSRDKIKICLISSSGGHFEQLMTLGKIRSEFSSFIVTEKTQYNSKNSNIKYFLKQINRTSFFWTFQFFINFVISIIIFIKEKPDFIISTGALSCLPIMLIGKLFKRKIIFIESFAKVSTPTKTGKFVYTFADIFIIQWEDLIKYYPKAYYFGGIY